MLLGPCFLYLMITPIVIPLFKPEMRESSFFISFISSTQSPITVFYPSNILAFVLFLFSAFSPHARSSFLKEESRIILRISLIILNSPIIASYFLSLLILVTTRCGSFPGITILLSSPCLVSIHLTQAPTQSSSQKPHNYQFAHCDYKAP